MVPTLTIVTFVWIIVFRMIYEYAKMRQELMATDGVGTMNSKLPILMQDGNEPFEKKVGKDVNT